MRLRHHCRLCGKLFCHACCCKKLLLPPKYRQQEPQRVCEMCSTLLWPLQPLLAGTQAAAAQQPVHDAIDSVALRSWLVSHHSRWQTVFIMHSPPAALLSSCNHALSQQCPALLRDAFD